jgi:hypothetical protein
VKSLLKPEGARAVTTLNRCHRLQQMQIVYRRHLAPHLREHHRPLQRLLLAQILL